MYRVCFQNYIRIIYKPPKITLNIMRPRQNGRHFADDIFKSLSMNGNRCILIEMQMKFYSKIPKIMVQIMDVCPTNGGIV